MTKVKVKVEQELDLDWESIQSIVVATLKEDFDAFSNDIQRLRMKAAYDYDALKPYELEDLEDWMTTRDAIYNVLRWYTTPDELDSFMRNRSLL